MQKWEYLFVTSEWSDYWRPRYVNQQELPNWENGPALSQFAMQLGDQGWELISCAPVTIVEGSGTMSNLTVATNYSTLELAFKRPKEMLQPQMPPQGPMPPYRSW